MKLFLAVVSVVILSITCVQSQVSQHDEFYCFSDDPVRPQDVMFAAQSGYAPSRGRRVNPFGSGKNKALIIVYSQVSS